MKLIQKNKYPIMVVLFFSALAGWGLTFLGSLKKDHSLDIYRVESKLNEENRQLIIKEREPYLKQIEQLEDELQELREKNAASDIKVNATETKVFQLKNNTNAKKQTDEKIKNFNNDNAAIVDYINKLREPNDY